MSENILICIVILVSCQASRVVSYSVVSSNSKTTRSATQPHDPLGSSSSHEAMETKMLKEFHDLCMSGVVPEAGLIMTDSTGENHKHWIYCSQLKHLNKSAVEPPQAISFVQPAPVEQMHRVIVNSKEMVNNAAAPKPPIIYVLPPKISNNYTVEYAHVDNDNSPVNYNQATAPVVHFLNRNAQNSHES